MIRVWEVPKRKLLGPPLRGHTDSIDDVAFSPDGRILASASWDGTIRFWKVAAVRGSPKSN
jgi:WD40 repeat protein